MNEIIIYGRKFKPNIFDQIKTVDIEIEKKFIKECDTKLSNLPRKEITITLKNVLKNYPFKEVTGRTILKIHDRSYKPLAKIRPHKGQDRYTDEDRQIYINNHKKTGFGPTKLIELELLKSKGKRNPSKGAVSSWIRRATSKNMKVSKIKDTTQNVIIKLGKHITVKEIIKTLQDIGIKSPSRKCIENILEMSGINVKQGKSKNEKIYICETALKYGIPRTPKLLLEENIKTSATRIREYFHELKIDFPDNSDSYRKYELTHKNFFSIIDSEEKAYWLGFIGADGGVRLGKLLEIEIKRSDKEHLLKFTQALGTTKNIYETTKYDKRNGKSYPAAKIAIFSKQIIKDLENYGIGETKSLTLDIDFNKIPKHLHTAFWRGFIDGDGWLSPTNPDINVKYPQLGLGSTKIMCRKFKEFIKNYLMITNDGPYKYDDRAIWIIQYLTTKNVLEICHYLYDDAKIYLDRKRQVANWFFDRWNNE